jgi:class 3 adenylate cyclase
VSVLDTLCDLGGDLGTMGLSSGTARALELFGTVLTPWSPYLLIMVLGLLRGELSRKRARLYTIGVLVMTVICAMTSIADLMGIADTRNGLTFAELSSGIIITVVLCALIFGVIIVWFAIEVVRLGIQLLRSKGYERWVGAGAVASSLLTLALGISSQLTGFVLSSWLSVLADYCSYVAVPVSVAIYLAIRSVHHNRLVARQRDELDLEVKERTAELSAEKERSDELLLNILPAEVAEELKRTGEAAARHFDQASVLFTDFKGFTEMSEQVGAGELLQELNTCFKAFDEIIGARGVEKIKTIGDAYMCVGGLPDPRSSAPVDVVLAALEMQAFMKKRRLQRQAQDRPAFTMRVGIHTGPVVAGIVGVKKFQYDIWGDTVNIASRMECSGEVGQVNISEATYALVKDASTPLGTPAFTFTPRGKVQAKGKGEMEMYFVNMAEAVPS